VSSAQTHPLVEDYLRRLANAAADLPEQRRVELVAEIETHLHDALSARDHHDEASVRNVLERLGAPEEIVDAVADPGLGAAMPSGQDASGSGRHIGGLEVAALITLTLGGFIVPIVGVLIGILLVWFTSMWTQREKAIGTALPVALLILPAAATAAIFAGWLPSTGAELLVMAVMFMPTIGGVITAIYLGVAAKKRTPAA
jgi:uncharacterized membrane protein